MPRRPKRCVYCGERDATSKDHVAPDCLFVDPKPPNLITVPACAQCNNDEKSQDDTFLRDALLVDIDNTHPIAQSLLAKLRRSVQQNLSEVARYVVRAEDRPRFDHEGNFLGIFPMAEFPSGRVTRILARMVQGLYYSECKVILPAAHRLVVRRHQSAQFPMLYERMQSPRTRVLGDVFGFAWKAVPDPLMMVWVLRFYESIVFSVMSERGLQRGQQVVGTS